jgi:hypothetical protein
MLNLLDIQAGQVIALKNGAQAEVLENIGDGIWLKCKMADGEEELVFCEDIAGLQAAGG